MIKRIPSNVVIAGVSLLLGFLSGIYVSDYFYEKGRATIRASLLDAAISDIEGWQSRDAYPMLHDSAGYAASGKPWPKLSLNGISELSRNIYSFSHFEHFGDFKDLVNICRRNADFINDRMSLRNISIVIPPGDVAAHNPQAYHAFQMYVRPSADSLLDFLIQNRKKLLGDY